MDRDPRPDPGPRHGGRAADPDRWRGREPGYAILHPIVDAIARLLTRIEVRGLEHLPRHGPVVLVANHVSHLDPLVLLSVCRRRGRRPRFLAVSGLWEVPVVGWLLRIGRMIEVQRGGGVEPMVRAACAALRAEQCVALYPEGTIVPPGEQRPARPGAGLLALRADAPVVPVAMHGVQRWHGRIPRLRQHVEVVVGPPIDVTPWRGREDRSTQLAVADHLLRHIHGLAA